MIKPKKIFYFITDLDIGGAEKLLLELSKRLPVGQFGVTVGYLEGKGGLQDLFNACRIPTIHIRSFWHLLRHIKSEKYDLIHTHLIKADFLGICAAKILGLPAVTTKHNTNYFHNRLKLWEKIDTCFNRMTEKIFCVSESVKNWYVQTQNIDPTKLEVIYNGIDIDYFRNYSQPKAQTEDEAHTFKDMIVTIASFTDQKGYGVLLEAAKILIRSHPNIYFNLIGEGPLFGALSDSVRHKGMQDAIKMPGTVRDVRPILAEAKIFVLPSLWEGFGLVILEAMAMGLPIVATRVEGIQEILGSEPEAILVTPNSSEALSDGISQVLENFPNKTPSYATLESYHIDRVVEKYAQAYERIFS